MSEGLHVCNRSRGHCPILVMSPEPKLDGVACDRCNAVPKGDLGSAACFWAWSRHLSVYFTRPATGGVVKRGFFKKF
jgi:hypothetical protein